MNNLAARFCFALIGILLILSFIFNKWINRELGETVKPTIVIQNKKLVPVLGPVEEYDMNSDYPPIPASEEQAEPVLKIPERIIDKRIIYEMPTSNKFLLQ